MPEFKLSDGTTLHYRVDDYTDPWRKAETILMIHGNAERSDSWYGWVPHLARHYRVIRPDTRGYGASGKVPKEFPWSVDVPVRDFVEMVKGLGIDITSSAPSSAARSPVTTRRCIPMRSPH